MYLGRKGAEQHGDGISGTMYMGQRNAKGVNSLNAISLEKISDNSQLPTDKWAVLSSSYAGGESSRAHKPHVGEVMGNDLRIPRFSHADHDSHDLGMDL